MPDPINNNVSQNGILWECTIYDDRKGEVRTTVTAEHEEDAYKHADIAASKLGCKDVTNILVGIVE